MGWTSWYAGYGKKRKDIILNEVVDNNNYEILRAEEKGSNVWIISKNKNTGSRFGVLFLTSYKNGEFAYKDISIDMSPYYWNCSKTYYEMCKEIYKNNTGYAQEWLKNYEKYNNAEKERKELIKSLKVGDIIEFETANYANKRQWQVSHILKNGTVLFEMHKLRGWKQEKFKKIDKFNDREYIKEVV